MSWSPVDLTSEFFAGFDFDSVDGSDSGSGCDGSPWLRLVLYAAAAAARKPLNAAKLLQTDKSKKSSSAVGTSMCTRCAPTSSGTRGFPSVPRRSVPSRFWRSLNRGRNGQRRHGFSCPSKSLKRMSTFRRTRSRGSRSKIEPSVAIADPNVARMAPVESRDTESLVAPGSVSALTVSAEASA